MRAKKMLNGKSRHQRVITSVYARAAPFMPREPQISAADRDFLVSTSVALGWHSFAMVNQ
jgi:hypothetical protein